LPRDEASTYEVFDRPPYRAWSQLALMGSLPVDDGVRRNCAGAATTPPCAGRSGDDHGLHANAGADVLHPESCLTLGGISLIEMLNTGTVEKYQPADVDGERLIDISISRDLAYGGNQSYR